MRTVVTHGTSGYRAGCRCDVCTSAESDRKRWVRGGGSASRAVVDAATGPAPMGETEHAVIEECEGIPNANPTMVVQARAMARLLDRPEVAGMHVRAAKELASLLNSMRPQPRKTKTRRRLATVKTIAKG